MLCYITQCYITFVLILVAKRGYKNRERKMIKINFCYG